MRGMKIDYIDIPGISFFDEMDDMDNWCTSCVIWGDYWEHLVISDVDHWCITFPDIPINNALIWSTEITNAYEAYLSYEEEYDFSAGTEGRVEISADGGNTWFILDVNTGTNPSNPNYDVEHYDLTPWAGQEVLIRFRAIGDVNVNPTLFGGHWCVRNLLITGKKDHTPPVTYIQMTGTQPDGAGWYNSPVKIKITAVDDAGMGEIHYILDGQETIVPGDIAEFTVSSNGEHNLEFWGVDAIGNVELPHNTVPTFRIDAGSPPSIEITMPEPGLYIFGNKILSSSKIFIIGAFTIEAAASDAESGIYKVAFYLDNDLIGEDTETPYSAYCALKHMGAGEIKAVAEDFSMNTAEDTLDVTYYKFL
jgi:hypothetical protein